MRCIFRGNVHRRICEKRNKRLQTTKKSRSMEKEKYKIYEVLTNKGRLQKQAAFGSVLLFPQPVLLVVFQGGEHHVLNVRIGVGEGCQ